MLGASIHFNLEGKEIKRQSLLVLSDDTTHDSVAVFASYMQLQKWLRDQMPALKRTTVVSDGCGGRISYQHIQLARSPEYPQRIRVASVFELFLDCSLEANFLIFLLLTSSFIVLSPLC